MRHTVHWLLATALILACAACAEDKAPSTSPDPEMDVAHDEDTGAITDTRDGTPDARTDAEDTTEPDATSDTTEPEDTTDAIDDTTDTDPTDTDPTDADPTDAAADTSGDPPVDDTSNDPQPPDADTTDTEPDAPPTAFCDPSIGATRPLEVCSPANPCTRVSGGGAITTTSDVPVCHTTEAGRPSYDDGAPIPLDIQGVRRWACAYVPPRPDTRTRPLLIFLHGAHGTAGNVYNATSLRGEVASRGWILVSVQARNLHWVNTNDGPHFDHYHRDLGSPSDNPDLILLDSIIDTAVGDLGADPRRIYLMGWSNGGFMAQMVGIARHTTPTPGGNRVAAVVGFTAADPFHTTEDGATPSCRLATYPTTTLPIALISRACDIVACDEDQRADLLAEGFPVSPGHVVQTWVDDLQGRMGDPNVVWIPILNTGQPATRCTGATLCSSVTATLNHLRWPDGVADESGIDYEPAMFDFMNDHPLP